MSRPRGSEGARLRLGLVPYLSVGPLAFGLDTDPRFELVRDSPAQLAERLRTGELDLGILPAAEYHDDEYAIVPGIAIVSRGTVRSVRLFHHVPLDRLTRVAVDSSSRSSAALLRIILRSRLGRDPEYIERPPSLREMLDEADGALLIGDAALFGPEDVPALDLGEEWARLTGLPFVYAFWAGRPGRLGAADVRRLEAALRAGLASVPLVTETHVRQHVRQGPSEALVRIGERYLRENVSYDLDSTALAGLQEFYCRAAEQGLVPRVPELRFYADR